MAVGSGEIWRNLGQRRGHIQSGRELEHKGRARSVLLDRPGDRHPRNEIAVHKDFIALDTVPHVLTAMTISEPSSVHVVEPASVPNANWLRPGIPSAGQQAFGDALLARHKFILIPSVLSAHSWNLIFIGTTAAGAYALKLQEHFALDTRLHPPSRR